MEAAVKVPETLMEVIRHFSDPAVCVQFFSRLRWTDGPECPRCQSKRLSFLTTRLMWKCLDCTKQFSVKVGTIFEDSAIGLDKWLCAMWLIANCKNGISSYEIAKDIKVTQKSAWFMLHRIRYAMRTKTFMKLSGQVEVDESFIGGKARNMHRAQRAKKVTGTGGKDKTVVMGMVERGGEVRAFVIDNRRKHEHAVINHAVEYVNGSVHTNTMENFWSLLKRDLHGTYVSVEPFHLIQKQVREHVEAGSAIFSDELKSYEGLGTEYEARYIDEQAFRYNQRHTTDADRFTRLCSMVAGKRLTWNDVTGKDAVERNGSGAANVAEPF
jgi:transposase-like protein